MKKTTKSKLTKIMTQTKSGLSIQTKTLLLLSMFLIASMGMMAAVGLVAKNKVTNKKEVTPALSKIDLLNQEIKAKGGFWQAGKNKFSNMSAEDLRKYLGVNFSAEEMRKIEEEKVVIQDSSKTGLPLSFDWRDQHGGLNYVSPVRDQGACGSCWAFADVGMIEGAVQTYYNQPNLDIDLSEQDFLTCMASGFGCSGASSNENLSFLSRLLPGDDRHGITTETCYPYLACDRSDPYFNCPHCTMSEYCRPGNQYGFDQLIRVYNTVEDVKQALMNYGPLYISMAVYQDFMSYDGGVYTHVSGAALGGHAITLVGWGNFDGLDYWIIKNSWGTDWGENGFGRINMNGSGINLYNVLGIVGPTLYDGTDLNVSCMDNDADGFCYWGTGPKPSSCPSCDDSVIDCNDADNSLYNNCNMASSLSELFINTTPQAATVYVRDIDSGVWVYRGITPLSVNLNAGTRDIKLARIGFTDKVVTTLVNPGVANNLSVTLDQLTNTYPGLWPVYLPQPAIWSSPVTADINNDNKLELIVLSNSGTTGLVNVFNSDGSIVSGWPQNVEYTPPFTSLTSSPAVADVNQDSFYEIVVGSGNHLYLFDHLGNILWHKNLSTIVEPNIRFSPVIYDVDGDGKLDIIFSTRSQMFIFDSAGRIKDGWPQDYPNNEFNKNAIAVADLDQDQRGEIVMVSQYDDWETNLYYKKIIIYNFDGSIKNEWQIQSGYYVDQYSGPVIGDINKDGALDIVVGEYNRVLAYNKDGVPLPGWPFDVTPYDYFPEISSLGLFDGNKDGYLELLVSTPNSIVLLNHVGQLLPDWPKTNFSSKGASIADINNDSNLDIVAGKSDGLYAWDLQGNIIAGYPKVLDGGFRARPLIMDFDNDRYSEIISQVGDYVHIWRTYSTYNKQQWSTFQHNDQRTGNINDYSLCSDNTPYGSCSVNKPYVCKAGLLVNDCHRCGCLVDYKCQSSGACVQYDRRIE